MASPAAPIAASPREIRVFISSTFRDMQEERDELMTQTWPELRRFCRERQVELVEVDLRWGISEEQSTRKEILKLCLDEIRHCRPFFIGLLGERYGWTPGADVFTADLKEEQPWLRELSGKSVTELEILHGVLNNPDMAGRSFFYFRDPAYAKSRGFLSENAEAACKQTELKTRIFQTCVNKLIPLRENYPDPHTLAALVLENLKAAIEAQFPIEDIPDALIREARDHEAFAETRRHTYIGRPDYFARLDRHAAGNGAPLVLFGDSGSGKSALLANWIDDWRKAHSGDFIFQHYIGGTPDSTEHWRLMTRLIAEIKRWSADPEELPRSHDDLIKEFPVWLAKARLKAERDGMRFIVVLDALNQLEDRDYARLLGWLPSHPFTGSLRLLVSTLPVKPPKDDPQKLVDDPLKVVTERGWESLRVEPLTPGERRRMIEQYLKRFGKTLDTPRLDRLSASPGAANPLYLKILLDELRVTGTHELLDQRLTEYLKAPDIPVLLKQVLARYQRDYERDRPGLVSEALGLIWAARRGLAESELLRLLKPAGLPQLPFATWSPLRSALEEVLVNRAGILNFAHDFLRTAVEAAFVPDEVWRDERRLQLARHFEEQPVTARSCDELPWLLWKTRDRNRLRVCLLNIERFLLLRELDENEVLSYWVWLGEEREMGQHYLLSFQQWEKLVRATGIEGRIATVANSIGSFLDYAGVYETAELFLNRALKSCEQVFGSGHPLTLTSMHNLAELLLHKGDFTSAEPLLRRALETRVNTLGEEHPETLRSLNSFAEFLVRAQGDYGQAETLLQRALLAREKVLGPEHPDTLVTLNDLAAILGYKGDWAGAESAFRRLLTVRERVLGLEHPATLDNADNLAFVLQKTGKLSECESLWQRALVLRERLLGIEAPDTLKGVTNLAGFYSHRGQIGAAESLYRRAMEGYRAALGYQNPTTLKLTTNLAIVLSKMGNYSEAEPLFCQVLATRERMLGDNHPETLVDATNLANMFERKGDLMAAEPLYRRAIMALLRTSGSALELQAAQGHYVTLLKRMGRTPDQIYSALSDLR